jgi:hypothetical protein
MRTRVQTRQRLDSGLLPLLIPIFSAPTRRFKVVKWLPENTGRKNDQESNARLGEQTSRYGLLFMPPNARKTTMLLFGTITTLLG